MMTNPTPKPGFKDDLIRLMARHRYAGLPGPVASTIRTAAAAGDQETLKEWLPRAVAQMITPTRRQP